MRAVQLVAGAAEDRAEARAGQEQDARDRQEDAEDRGAGRAEPQRNERLEPVADEAAVGGAEGQHQAGERNRQSELERPHVDERALRHHQGAERDENDRREVGGSADRALREICDRPAAEAEPEHGREEHPDRGEAEADQLGMLVGVRERGFPRRLRTVRFLTRLGVFGEALWGRLLRAMEAHFALRLISPAGAGRGTRR